MALTCAVLFGVASCSLDDVKNQQLLSGYFTITGSYPNYKLIQDNGTIIYPSAEEVNEITKGVGFGNHKRVYFDVYFYEDDVTTTNDVSVVLNPDLKNGVYLTESTLITKEEADKANITVPDSIFDIKTIENSWIAYGYLNTIFKAEYSVDSLRNTIFPDTKLCVTNTEDNAVTLTMLYNRHTKKDAISDLGSFVYSFDISNINVPGNDSVAVTFETQGQKAETIKVPRTIFNYAQ